MITALAQNRIGMLEGFFDFIYNKVTKKKRFVVLYGGAGSGKSHSTAIHFVTLVSSVPNVNALVTRKTFPALRITAYALVLQVLYEMRIPFTHNRSSGEIAFPNGSVILFKSMDDPEKIKSLNLDVVWMEEATDFTYEDFLQINLRCRGKALKLNQIFVTFNPIDEFHWLNTHLLQRRKDECAVHQSTYRDNLKYLPDSYIKELEALKDSDENHYRIYAQGLFGRLENIIYSNWDIVDKMPSVYYDCYGLDFGFTQPACLVGIMFQDGSPTVKEMLYETNLTNPELIQRLKVIVNRRAVPIFADPAEPKSIADLQQSGFNVIPADNSVWDGIKKVRARPLHIEHNSINLLAEIRSYVWRKDRLDRILEEPVKFRDHALDATRYAISTYWGGKPISGSILDIRQKERERQDRFSEAMESSVTPERDIDW